MDDTWSREVELQKVYNLSPKESETVVLFESGKTARQIAGMRRVSVSTINTMLKRAKEKMEKQADFTILVIWKGNLDVTGVAVKVNAMRVLLNFVSKAMNVPFFEGNHTFIIRCPNEMGDAQWLKDNVFRYVDILGTTVESESKARADLLMDRYESANTSKENKVGVAILKRYLDDMYMQYDVWSE